MPEANNDAVRIATVGSPSSNYEVTLDVSEEARAVPLVGSVVSLENPMGEGSELALGTVTEVITTNKWHEDPSFRGLLRTSGELVGMSGDDGDIRRATIRIQAAWKREDRRSPWIASGPNLRMSPATGTSVKQIDGRLVNELIDGAENISYMGHLAGTEAIPLPLNMPDFSSSLGAYSSGVYGLTGSGKTQATALMLAGQMRFPEHGVIIVDPQGQWASEEGMVFSLQGFASELGRNVMVHRISTDLRLAKDAPLMTNLLKHTRLVVELGLKHENTEEIVWYEVTKALRERDDWTADESGVLLRSLLEHLAADGPASRVYTTPENAARFQQRVNDVLGDAGLFSEALNQFAPIHNLFQSMNPSGQPRHDLNRTLTSVFDRVEGSTAPLLILDMSSMPMPGMDEEVEEAAERAYEILEKDAVKAAILRNLFHTLKRASEARFRAGNNLNTLVVLDEAWRYAAPPSKVEEEELQQLSKDLAGYARDTRKFGIGWMYISQSTRSVNPDIWDQMTVRLFGYGLNGADIDKMGEVVDDKSALRLYRSSGNPRSTGVYPFMMTGPVSPLAANATPVMLHVYTDFQAFREDNDHWIRPQRTALGLPVLSGQPQEVRGVRPGRLVPRGAVRDTRKAIIETSKAARDNRLATGTQDPEGFGNSLDNLDDEDTSF